MAQCSSRCHCSVPQCTSDKQKQPYLSFHCFPNDPVMKSRWVKAIRRDEGPKFKILRGSTFVCSRHFNPEDMYTTPKGRNRIRHGAVPSKFAWNNWESQKERKSAQDRDRGRLGGDVRAEVQEEEMVVALIGAANVTASEHDYALTAPPGTSDEAAAKIAQLEAQVQQLKLQIQELTSLRKQPRVKRFCASDEDFHFFTRFPSEEVFMVFWESISLSTSSLVYWSRAQKMAHQTRSPCWKLPLIDECFMFFCRIAAGMKEKVLAAIFKVSPTAVSQIILMWTSYLYQLLASQPTWMTRRQLQATMPEQCRQYCPCLRVIIDCTEIHCETGSSLTSQPDTFSSYKNHSTFKGLIGVAPCGVVTFVSKLYSGSISDTEITRKSGITQLLFPGDGVMADKGFLIEEMLAEVGATLITPPLKKAAELTGEDTHKTQAIACLRVLAERAIQRVKEYHIWDGVVPLSLLGSVNHLWAVCCLLTNYQGPLDIKGDRPVCVAGSSL